MNEPHRIRFHVHPHEGGWIIQREGESLRHAIRSSAEGPSLDTKERALYRARELAQRHEFSCVILHGPDGAVEQECFWGGRNEDAVR